MFSLKNKIIMIIVFFALNINSQPYLFNVQLLNDSTDFGPYRLDKVNLNNASISPFIGLSETFFNYSLLPTNDWIVIRNKDCYETEIYKISDTTDYISNPNVYGCFDGGILFSDLNNKIYYFEGSYYEIEQLNSIDVSTGVSDSLFSLPYSYNQQLGNQEAFLSSGEDILYFNVADTTYPPSVNDKDFVHYFSTSSNQLLQTRRLYEFGYPNADGYLLHKGRKGKAVVESFYRNQTYDSYYRLYDFDNDSVSSEYVFYQGYTTPYFTGEGDYLVLPEEIYSSNRVTRTGTFYIYEFSSSNLLKTIALPSGGKVYTFDNYPNNIYYVIDIEEPTRQIYTLKMDSILNVLDLTSLSPSSAIINSPPFTLTVNGHGFDSLSTVYFNDTAKTTTYVSDSVLTAEISTSDISTIGNYPVWVTDEWGTSDTLTFTVVPHPPVLTSISPSLALPVSYYSDNTDFTVTATGTSFTDSSVIYFDGTLKTTTYVSDSVLTFQLNNYNDISSSNDYSVWVSNYASNSDTLYFSVVDSLPQSLAPVVNCVRNNGDRTFTAFFGYNKSNNESVFISIGGDNYFNPIQLFADRGQPNIFLPGIHSSVFSVVFDGNNLIWNLNGTSATANRQSTPCP